MHVNPSRCSASLSSHRALRFPHSCAAHHTLNQSCFLFVQISSPSEGKAHPRSFLPFPQPIRYFSSSTGHSPARPSHIALLLTLGIPRGSASTPPLDSLQLQNWRHDEGRATSLRVDFHTSLLGGSQPTVEPSVLDAAQKASPLGSLREASGQDTAPAPISTAALAS